MGKNSQIRGRLDLPSREERNAPLIIDDKQEDDHQKLTILMRTVLSNFRRQLVYENKMSEADFESYLDTTVVQIETLIGE